MKTAPWFGVLAGLCLAAESLPPPLQPSIQSIFPRGARQGSGQVITISGANLEHASQVRVSGKGVRAEILENTASRIRAKVTVAADAPANRRDLRVFTPQGSFVQVFEVGALPEVLESEPNDDAAHARALALPVVVNGQVQAGDYDHFRFRARTGQHIVFDLFSSRIGTRFDGVLSLLDERGREIDSADDSFFDKDPRLIHRFQQAGEYTLRVSGFREAGSAGADYRLLIGDVPYGISVFPAGGPRGTRVAVTVSGVNLNGASTLEIDGIAVRVAEVGQEADSLQASITLPETAEPGVHRLRLIANGQPLPGALPFVISDFAETVLRGPPPAEPVALDSPRVFNGIIRRPKQADNFLLDVRDGERIMLQGDAMSLGNFLDPAVTIYDTNDRVVAYADEAAPNGFDKEPPTVDFHMAHAFERAGRYRVEFRDAGMRGSESFVYRLLIGRAEPRFEIHTLTNQLSAAPGQTALLPVRVKRTAGWSQPVEVWVDGLPARVESRRVTAEPINTRFRGTFSEDFFIDGTNVELPVQVHAGAAAGSHVLHVKARGTHEGRSLKQSARVWYPWQQTGYLRGPAGDQEFVLTIGEAPVFDLEAPASLELTSGRNSTVTLKVRWLQPGLRSLLKVEAVRLPAGVELAKVETEPGGDSVIATLRASEAPAEPSAWLTFEGSAKAGDQTFRKTAPDIQVRWSKGQGVHEKTASR
jgi:hypothetical protein